MNNIVKIFDTTLRDGEQSPGATMTSTEKLKLACNLSLMGVDIIEAGFPAASPDDLEAVKSIALEVGNQKDSDHTPVICALARTIKGDIDTAWEGIKQAVRPRIHTFIATSDIHMQYKLNMTRDEVLQTTYKMVSYAHSLCKDVEFSPEDAGRSDLDFLYQVLAEAIRAGASTINIPDTVGYTIPDEFGGLIREVINHTPGIEHCIVSVHCHNDLGLATANTLAGIMAGARQAEVTINGIGERAGNTSLEEVVMALNTRYPLYGLKHNIDTTHIMRLSRMVSNFTGIMVQANKAIVGANAFAHEAGIHQDGLIKHQQTYEIMRPESVGLIQSQLVLGKHSGRHAFKNRMVELGYNLSDDEIEKLFTRFKTLADKKKTITNADLEALVSDEIYQHHEFFTLESLQVACGTKDMPTATVRLLDRYGEAFIKAAVGTGPVDAVYKAIDAIIQTPNKLLEFNINAITEGIDALGEVTVRIEQADSAQNKISQTERELRQSYGGYGADTDIIVASAKAYLAAVNKMLVANEDLHAAARNNHQSSKAHAKTGINDFPLIERSPEAFPNLEIYPKNWDLTDY